MARFHSYGEQAANRAEQTARRGVDNPWFEMFARLGYAAKGVVYILFGLLAAQGFAGRGGGADTQSSALASLVDEPFGRVLLALIAIGLLGYVALRLVQAILNPQNEGAAPRIGYVVVAIVYGALTLTAARLALGWGSSGGGNSIDQLVTQVFAQPFGRWAVGIAGAIVVGAGLYHLYKAFTTDFKENMRWGKMNDFERTSIVWLGRIGYTARGIVLGLIGAFLLQAAILFQPEQARDTGGALQALSRPPFGTWTVVVVAIGLAAYGMYMLAAARHSRIEVRQAAR